MRNTDFNPYDPANDFEDLDGNLRICAIMAYPRFAPDDPRHLSTKMRANLARAAISQIEKRQAENLRILDELQKARGAPVMWDGYQP